MRLSEHRGASLLLAAHEVHSAPLAWKLVGYRGSAAKLIWEEIERR